MSTVPSLSVRGCPERLHCHAGMLRSRGQGEVWKGRGCPRAGCWYPLCTLAPWDQMWSPNAPLMTRGYTVAMLPHCSPTPFWPICAGPGLCLQPGFPACSYSSYLCSSSQAQILVLSSSTLLPVGWEQEVEASGCQAIVLCPQPPLCLSSSDGRSWSYLSTFLAVHPASCRMHHHFCSSTCCEAEG